MVYVSLVDLVPLAKEDLGKALGEVPGAWAMVGSFFAGVALIAVIDRFVPEDINPHEGTCPVAREKKLMRTGLMTAVALAIHNFPEGFATFISGLEDASIAIPVAVAIGIHNVPEGIAVAVPILAATASRKRAFGYAFLSGLAEPLGALVGFLLLRPFMTDAVMGCVLAAVAGIMVFISFDKLLPTAEEFGHHHVAVYGLVAGMAVMACSLVLFM